VELQDAKSKALEKELDETRRVALQRTDSFKDDRILELEFELAEAKLRCANHAEELKLLRKQCQGTAEFKDFNS